MKVLAINGSPRKNGNTAAALNLILDVAKQAGYDTEFLQLGGNVYVGCRACGLCRKNKNMRCAIEDDGINAIIEKMVEADAIIIGSPTYFSNVTTEVKALIDRAGYVTRGNGMLLKRKVGVPVVSARRAGANFTLSAINFFFNINEMIVPSSSYWNMTLSRDIGDFANDEEGKQTMNTLAENMVWLLDKISK